jgi:hypothetical protein
MKYKDWATKQLDILSNRLSGLKDAIDNNKPMSKEEIVRQLAISVQAVEQISEKVGLEDNDFGRAGQ